MRETSGFILIKTFVAATAGFLISIPFAVQMLFWLSVVDLLTALFARNKSFSEHARKDGLAIILSLAVYFLYNAAKQQSGFNLGFDLGSAVAMFYVLGLAVAILQNVSAAGLALPPVLINLLTRAEGLTATEKAQIDTLEAKQQVTRDDQVKSAKLGL